MFKKFCQAIGIVGLTALLASSSAQAARTSGAEFSPAVPVAGSSSTLPRFPKPFSHYADGAPLYGVLTAFARSQGLTAEIDPAVEGAVSGRFAKVDPQAFLEAMAEAYGIGWYVLGDVLHVYRRRDAVRDFLSVPAGSGEELLASLRTSGFVADELPGQLNAQGNMITFRGPPGYIAAIRKAADAYMAVQSEKIVMRVFPVKHAWADDITLESMSQSVTVPGIATILRGMVMGQSVGGRTVSERRTPETAPSVPSLGAPGVSRQGAYREREAARTAAAAENPVASGSVSIMADPRVNAVLVSDALYRMPYYEAVIEALDKPVELVEIHAAIVDIDTNASRDLGIDLSGRAAGGNWQGGGSLGAGSDGVPSIGTSAAGGALISTIYTHGTDYFMARISALEEQNAARMLGRPSVLTIDNVEAVLENTTSYYIPLRGTDAVDLYKVDSGTVLRVTPHIIHEDGRTSIKLAVSVQDDQNNSAGGYQSIGENSSEITVNPIKQTRINTQAMVEAGQSLLIGGYYYEQKSESESGVPILKDIPVLGSLFEFSSKEGRQMERLILITPRLVTSDGANVPLRVREGGFRRSATQPDYEMPSSSAFMPMPLTGDLLGNEPDEGEVISIDDGGRAS